MDTPLRVYNTLEKSDLTEDGIPDLVMASDADAEVWVYPQLPSSGLAAGFPIPLAGLTFMSGFTVADMDRDGYPDIVVSDQAHSGMPRGVHVFYRGPGGTISNAVRLPLTGMYDRPGAVKVADIDGNGHPDIVVMIHSDDRMAYFLQDGSGFAAPVFLNTDDNPWTNTHYLNNSFAIADVDADGCPDVVLAEGSSSLRVFFGRNCRIRPVRTGGNLPPQRQ